MIIGLYSDSHISYTSSILPLTSETRYTCRLNMIINSYKWMYEEFSKNNVELICNCGDTFDSHIVKAEEIEALTECLSYSKGVEEIWITGNHEMFNNEFYSTSLVNNYEFISLYKDAQKVNDIISVIPYKKYSDEEISKFSDISNEVVISHIDLIGSHVRPDFMIDSGIDPEILALHFKASFNGHIHTAEEFDTSCNFVANVGSLTSISFSDSNSYVPNICIYNTVTGEFKRIQNPNAILFRKMTVSSVTELIDKLSKINKRFKYVLRVTCPFNIKDNVKDIINNEDYIIANRIILTIDNKSPIIKDNSIIVDLDDSDILSKFKSFLLENKNMFKYPDEIYSRILQDLN